MCVFKLIGTHFQPKASAWSWPNPLCGEWYYYTSIHDGSFGMRRVILLCLIRLHFITFLNNPLTHWGRVTHICVNELTTIGSDNGLSPDRRLAIIWSNAGILLIRPFVTNGNEILIEMHTFSFNKMHFKMSSGKWRPFLSQPKCVKGTPDATYILNTAEAAMHRDAIMSQSEPRDMLILFVLKSTNLEDNLCGGLCVEYISSELLQWFSWE